MSSEFNQKSKFEIVVKWASITCISCTLILVAAIFLFSWKFTPLIKIDEHGVQLLNGAISINDKGFKQ